MRFQLDDGGTVRQILHIDDADGRNIAVEVYQDERGAEAILRRVRQARERGADSKSREFRLLAEVPMAVYLRACTEGWVNDAKAWKKWLNDSDNKAFRVHEGRA